LDANSWATDDLTLTGLLRNPAYRAAWKMARNGMNARYREFVDSKLKGIGEAGSRNIVELWNTYIGEERIAA